MKRGRQKGRPTDGRRKIKTNRETNKRKEKKKKKEGGHPKILFQAVLGRFPWLPCNRSQGHSVQKKTPPFTGSISVILIWTLASSPTSTTDGAIKTTTDSVTLGNDLIRQRPNRLVLIQVSDPESLFTPGITTRRERSDADGEFKTLQTHKEPKIKHTCLHRKIKSRLHPTTIHVND